MASAAADAPRRKRGPHAFGIDPGSVFCGVAERMNGRVISLERVQFRAPHTGGNDLGHARLIGQVTKWIRENAGRFSDAVIFIEDQPPDAYGREGQAVQYTFQAFFGDQCVPVNAAACKARYGEHFPRHPRYAEFAAHRRAENQKAYDRKNAIEWGRKYIPENVTAEYEKKNPQKKDDAYEAALYALYGEECMIDAEGSLRSEPTPIPRRKRGEVHPRGRPKAKSATPKPKAKSAAKPKAKTAGRKRTASKAVVSSSDDDDDVVDLTNGSAENSRRKGAAKRRRT